MTARSAALAQLTPPASVFTTAFTVPAGMVYILKSVIVYNGGGAADTCDLRMHDAAGANSIALKKPAPAAGAVDEWDGWVAFNAGDRLDVFSNNGTSRFWLSGAKLLGTP